MDILEEITAFKKGEVEIKKQAVPVNKLENSFFFNKEVPSFYDALSKPEPSIIGEFKRKSPSKGVINNISDVEDVARGYQDAGISAISILTDREFFGGDNHDLEKVAGFIKIPLLRKEFIVDEYQVIEAKSIGACAILIIASILNKTEVIRFSGLANTLGLDILFEIHEERDLDKIVPQIKIVGVNNRNLKTFNVNPANSRELLQQLPADCLKVAESGIKSYSDVKQLFTMGYDAFLIGEYFMRSPNPGLMASELIKDLKSALG
jgi:indole-3-glycerol phosphate synthase